MKLSILVTEMLCSTYIKFTKVTSNVVHPMYNTFSSLSMSTTLVYVNYRRPLYDFPCHDITKGVGLCNSTVQLCVFLALQHAY